MLNCTAQCTAVTWPKLEDKSIQFGFHFWAPFHQSVQPHLLPVLQVFLVMQQNGHATSIDRTCSWMFGLLSESCDCNIVSILTSSSIHCVSYIENARHPINLLSKWQPFWKSRLLFQINFNRVQLFVYFLKRQFVGLRWENMIACSILIWNMAEYLWRNIHAWLELRGFTEFDLRWQEDRSEAIPDFSRSFSAAIM